jgi:hypothetical protein
MRQILHAFSILSLAAAGAAQEAAPPKEPINAAALYRQAWADLRKATRNDHGEPIDTPYYEVATVDDYRIEPWPGLVESLSGARGMFEQATALPDCAFDGEDRESLNEVEQHVFELQYLMHLVAAAALQQVDTHPDASFQAACRLLDHARHLTQDPSLMALALRYEAVSRAIQVSRAVLRVRGDTVPTLPALQRAHARLVEFRRNAPTQADIENRIRHNAGRDLATVLAMVKDERRRERIEKRVMALLADLTEPLRGDEIEDLDAFERDLDARVKELKDRQVLTPDRLPNLLTQETEEVVASVLTTLVACSPLDLLRRRLANGREMGILIGELQSRLGAAAHEDAPGNGRR